MWCNKNFTANMVSVVTQYCYSSPCTPYRQAKNNEWTATCDFQQCGILTSVDSDQPLQPTFKFRTPNDARSVAEHSYNIQATRKGSDQTVHKGRLVWAFAGRTYHIVGNLMSRLKYVYLCFIVQIAILLWDVLCLFDLILFLLVNNFQLCLDGSSLVEPVLSKDKCVLLKDTTQWCRWDSNSLPLSLESSTLRLSHCAPSGMSWSSSVYIALFNVPSLKLHLKLQKIQVVLLKPTLFIRTHTRVCTLIAYESSLDLDGPAQRNRPTKVFADSIQKVGSR